MTVWDARRAQHGDLRRLLCGRMVDGQYSCPELVAHKALWSADEQGPPQRDEVWLPVGLTDEGSPGAFRWSGDSKRRMLRGQHRLRRRGGETQSIRLGDGSIVVPCRLGHHNRVTRAHL